MSFLKTMLKKKKFYSKNLKHFEAIIIPFLRSAFKIKNTFYKKASRASGNGFQSNNLDPIFVMYGENKMFLKTIKHPKHHEIVLQSF